MKKLLTSVTLLAALLFAGNLFAQDQPADPNAPVMKFERDTIDYGTIPHNADGFRAFKFVNVGKEPLIIKEAHGSCGCTVPTAPKEPIQPNQQAEIKVHYATDRIGMFIKNVTLTSNANPNVKVLTIKGNVLPDPVTAAPANPTTPTNNAAQPASAGGH